MFDFCQLAVGGSMESRELTPEELEKKKKKEEKVSASFFSSPF